MTKIDSESAPTQSLNGATKARSMPPTVEVSFDSELGVATTGAPPSMPSLSDILRRAQERREGRPAVTVDALGQETPAEPEATTETADAPDAAPEGDPPAEQPETQAAPEGEEAPTETAAEEPAQPSPSEVQLRVELEDARSQLAMMRRQVDQAAQGRRDGDFEAYAAKPVDWIRARVAEALGVQADDPIVGDEMTSLFGEVTWSQIPVQDLPEAQQAQLRTDRLDRRIRLDTHRRQAEQRARETSAQEERARNYAKSVWDTVRAQFPAAALVERRHGVTIEDAVLARLRRAVDEGEIRDWQNRNPTDVLTEAYRLLDSDNRQWAQTMGSHLASLIPASAPAAPQASPKPQAGQTPTPSQAAPAKTPGPKPTPRTLTPQKVGAAPARPVATTPADESLPLDPEARREALLRRAQARRS